MKSFTKFAGGFTGIHNTSTNTDNSYKILLVGAGGGGGSDVGGGGGGGQVVSDTATFSGTGPIMVTVGAGGGVAALRYGMKGGDSSVSGPITISSGTTSIGGSGGQGRSGGGTYAGGTGYNGGGGSYQYTTSTAYSGGFAGSSSVGSGSSLGCGGGGGSGGAGGIATATSGGNGGNGVASLISGSSINYGGGGGGAQYTGGTVGAGTDGGANVGASAVANRGGGGGAAQSGEIAGSGGSGVVILSHPTSLPAPISYSGATVTTVGNKKIYTWTTSGSFAMSAISSPTVISGLVGWYDMSAITSTQWTDKSGSGNHATITGATVSSIAAGNGSTLITSCLYGSSGSHTVLWPSGILPSTYTLFHVTRYQGGANSRIYTANSGNWLSGHWGGISGQYYHEGWLTDSSTNYYGNNWFITTDQNSLGRTNGITRGTSGGSGYANRLGINVCPYGEQSYWQTVECIVYNRTLTSSEYANVELYLSVKYGIALGV